MPDYTIKVPPKFKLITDYKSFSSSGRTYGELYTDRGFYNGTPALTDETFTREITPLEERSSHLIPLKRIQRTQLKNAAGSFMITTKGKKNSENFIYQFLAKDGSYNFKHQVNNRVIKELKVVSPDRTLLTGFKGKIERIAHIIGNNKAGVERPVLRKVAGVIQNLLRK